MEDAVSMHVVDGLEELVHVVLDAVLGQVVALAFDGVVHVHVHQFEDEGQPPRGLITTEEKSVTENI